MAPRIILAILVAFLLVFYFSQRQTSDAVHGFGQPDSLIKVDCNLSEVACPIRMGELQFEVAMTPKGLPVLEPIRLAIKGQTPVIDASQWLVWFEGRDMEMGRHILVPSDDASQSQKSFLGIIPVCTVDENMVWLLNVQLSADNTVRRFVFAMTSDHSGAKGK